jgi:thymidylate kinase
MFTVALIGPDGAGKSSISQQLEKTLALPVKYVYMGVNLEASRLMLPTTRLVLEVKRMRGRRPDATLPQREEASAKLSPKSIFKGLKSVARMVFWMSEEWFRQIVCWYYQLRGYIVLFDRHFYSDYYAHDIVNTGQKRPLTRRIHGFVLDKLYPKPDLFIMLDAPAEVLFARKGEGTLEFLENRRQEYLMLRGEVKHFEIVDATQPPDKVLSDVAGVIQRFYEARRLRA